LVFGVLDHGLEVNLRTLRLVFAVSPLSFQHLRVGAMFVWYKVDVIIINSS